MTLALIAILILTRIRSSMGVPVKPILEESSLSHKSHKRCLRVLAQLTASGCGLGIAAQELGFAQRSQSPNVRSGLTHGKARRNLHR